MPQHRATACDGDRPVSGERWWPARGQRWCGARRGALQHDDIRRCRGGYLGHAWWRLPRRRRARNNAQRALCEAMVQCRLAILVHTDEHGNAGAGTHQLQILRVNQRRCSGCAERQREAHQHEAGDGAASAKQQHAAIMDATVRQQPDEPMARGPKRDWRRFAPSTYASPEGRRQRGAVTVWSMAPNRFWPSRPFISMRIVSPYRMKPVEGWPSCMVSMARFSAMQL